MIVLERVYIGDYVCIEVDWPSPSLSQQPRPAPPPSDSLTTTTADSGGYEGGEGGGEAGAEGAKASQKTAPNQDLVDENGLGILALPARGRLGIRAADRREKQPEILCGWIDAFPTKAPRPRPPQQGI